MRIYADNAATTALSEKAWQAMQPALKQVYGNPSSLHSEGQQAARLLEQARTQVASLLGVSPKTLYFTSGGTESANWAVYIAAQAGMHSGKRHVITTAFEHHAVLHPVQRLQQQGFTVTYLPVSENGVVNPADLMAALREDTCFVSIMLANNEIGTIQLVAQMAAACHAVGAVLHTDAVQAMGHIPLSIAELGVDMLSFSAHKFNGPKGIGALYVGNGVPVVNFVEGGAQEFGKRGGTSNVAGALGMAAALEEALADLPQEAARVTAMRDALAASLCNIPQSRLNGAGQARLPGIINVSFSGIEGDTMLMMLDMAGIAASSGSACTSGSLSPSHVLLALGLSPQLAQGSLRLSLGRNNTLQEVAALQEKIPPIIEKLRQMR